MPEAILTELSALIRRHPWWQARTRLVLAILEQHAIAPPCARPGRRLRLGRDPRSSRRTRVSRAAGSMFLDRRSNVSIDPIDG